MVRFGALCVIAAVATGVAVAQPTPPGAQPRPAQQASPQQLLGEQWPIEAGVYRIKSADTGLCLTAAADAVLVLSARAEDVVANLQPCGPVARAQDQVFRLLPAAPIAAPKLIGPRAREKAATAGYTIRTLHANYGSPARGTYFSSAGAVDLEPEICLGAAGGDPAQGALVFSEACADWRQSRSAAGAPSQTFAISGVPGAARLRVLHSQMCLTAADGALTQEVCGADNQTFVLEALSPRAARQASWRYRLNRPLTFAGLSAPDAAAALKVRPLVGGVLVTAGVGHWTRELRIGDTFDDGGVECLRRCQDDPTCAAFTWTKPGASGAFARCFLQMPGYATMGCDYCVSGVVRMTASPRAAIGIAAASAQGKD